MNKFLIGNSSLHAVHRAMYSASLVDNNISVCNLLNHRIGHPTNWMTHPVRDPTLLGSCPVSLV